MKFTEKIKRILGLSLCCVMMNSVYGSDFPAKSVEFDYTGRFFMTAKGSVRFDYPGFCISTGFTGTSVKARFKPNSGFYLVEIDNNIRYKLSTDKGSGTFLLAEGLSKGKHSLKVTLVSEGFFCKPEFFGVALEDGETLFKLEKKKRLKLEFIGNSITCGYGVEAKSEQEPFADSTSNFLKSFAGLTALHYDAECFVAARSGIGIHRNYGESLKKKSVTMPMAYPYADISSCSVKWDFSSFVPDVVCINLGTNDLSTPGYDLSIFSSKYESFVRFVRKAYPQAQIVLLSGCMLPEGVASLLDSVQEKIVSVLVSEGDDRIYRYGFPSDDGSMGYGADYHPSERMHSFMAEELIGFLDENVIPKVKK